MKQVLFVIFALSTVLGAFQNCQRASYNGNQSTISEKAGQLTATTTDDPEDTLSGPGSSPYGLTHTGSAPSGLVDCATSSQNGPTPNAHRGGPTQPRTPNQAEPDAASTTGDYVCILNGPGKSVKLGLNAENLLKGQNEVPGVLCMSVEACSEIAARLFQVKGPEWRGYCKNSGGNPHVVHITNLDLDKKVKAQLPPVINPPANP